MKKNYEAPSVELVKFEYKDQVVANSGCGVRHTGDSGTCDEWSPWQN